MQGGTRVSYAAEKVNNALAFHLSKKGGDETKFTNNRSIDRSSEIPVYCWPREVENEDIILLAHQSDSSWGLHSHDYFVMNYVYSGAFLVTIDGNEYRMEKDALSLLQPGTAHRIVTCPEAEPCILLSITAKNDLVYHSILPLISESALYMHFFVTEPNNRASGRTIEFHDQHNDTIRRLFDAALVESVEREASYSKLLEYIFAAVLIFLSRSYKEYFRCERKSIDVEPILDFISKNCSTVTLVETAEHFHYHPSYLSSALRRETGRSFGMILKDFKVTRACRMLEQTSLPVNTIATLAGYPNLGNFYKVFKTETGCTPNEYRQQKAAGENPPQE